MATRAKLSQKEHSLGTREKMRAAQLGERGSNWQGGKSSLEARQRAWLTRRWRDAVAGREGFVCHECGADPLDGADLEFHHVKPFTEYPELREDPANGIVLCIPCHARVHGRLSTRGESMGVIYAPKGAAAEYARLAVNLYQSCPHGCGYCYAPRCLHVRDSQFRAPARPRSGIVDRLRRDAKKHANSPIPVLMSFIGDCYPSEFDGEDVTRDAIAILREHDIPVHVLTKGGMRASRDFPLLQGPACAFGSTLCWTDDQDRLHWEPGAAPVADRITAIKLAHNLGIRTFVSVEPVIVPEQCISLIQELSEWVDEWRLGRLNHHPLAAEIEWARWAPKLLAAVKASGRDYLMKQSLRQYLPEGSDVERRANV